MLYANAKNLQKGDEVVVKKTGEVLAVVSISTQRPMNMIHRKEVFVLCSDRKTYYYSDLKRKEE